MEKLGRILLFCINVCINLFLICLVILVSTWLIKGIPPRESIQSSLNWIERTFRSSPSPQQKPIMGEKQLKNAQENMYHSQRIKKNSF